MPHNLLLAHLGPGARRVIDPADVYYLEADAGETRIRLRGSQILTDVRPIADLEDLFTRHGFLRIHREYLVNPARVRDVRHREDGPDWELKLEPPVNRVLPISRSRLQEVWARFGE